MYRLIFISLLSLYSLSAQSYQEILDEALQKNIMLQVAQRKKSVIALKGEIETRRKNPNLELEVSDFLELDRDRFGAINDFGLRAGVSQELLLPNVKKEIEHLTQAKIGVAKENYTLLKSEFIYQFTLKYLAYRNALKKERFLEEALRISNEILETVKIRYEHGAVPKSEFLQSRLDTRQLLNHIDELRLETLTKRGAFLLFSNIQKDIEIDEGYVVRLKKSSWRDPLQKLKEQEERLSTATLKRLSHAIETIEVFSEIEKDPQEDIFRVGISVPLPFYDTKSQERALAKIARSTQIAKQESREYLVGIKLKQLHQRQQQIEETKVQYQSRLEEQKQLFEMYKQGYDIAKVNLFKLQESQKRMVEIQESLSLLEMRYEKNIVTINYLRGAYHE
jgi:cobalt-zinc-cadmium efflux system outer membrane protein